MDSAAGSAGHAQKDAKVELLAREAMGSGRFDGACAASALVYNDYKRDGLLADMVRRAANDCADLPWGAFAAKKMNGAGVRIDAHVLLNTRWRECAVVGRRTAGVIALTHTRDLPTNAIRKESCPTPFRRN